MNVWLLMYEGEGFHTEVRLFNETRPPSMIDVQDFVDQCEIYPEQRKEATQSIMETNRWKGSYEGISLTLEKVVSECVD